MSNNFYIGTQVPSSIYLGTDEVSAVYLGTEKVWELNRNPYQQVEWISNISADGASGNPYINTGIVPSDHPAGLKIDIRVYSTNPGSVRRVFGARVGNVRSLNLYLNPNGGHNVEIGGGQGVSQTYSWNSWHTISAYSNESSKVLGASFDGGTAKTTNHTGGLCTASMHLMGYNYSTPTYAPVRVSSFSIRDYGSNTLLCDYTPAYRKADGVIGMLDSVSGNFMTNAASSGKFAKGADVA